MIPKYKTSIVTLVDLNTLQRKDLQVYKFTISSEEIFSKYIRKPLLNYTAKLMRLNHKIFYWEEFRSAIFIKAMNYIANACAEGATFQYVNKNFIRIILPSFDRGNLCLHISSGTHGKVKTHLLYLNSAPVLIKRKISKIITIQDVVNHLKKLYFDIPDYTLLVLIFQGIERLNYFHSRKLIYCLILNIRGNISVGYNNSMLFYTFDSILNYVKRGLKMKWSIKLKHRKTRIKALYVGLTETLYLMYLDSPDPNFIPEGYVTVSRDLLRTIRCDYAVLKCNFNINFVLQKVQNYEIDNSKFIFKRHDDGYHTISST